MYVCMYVCQANATNVYVHTMRLPHGYEGLNVLKILLEKTQCQLQHEA